MLVRQPFTIGGSGSTYLYGHCDYTFRKNMSKEDCVKFVVQGRKKDGKKWYFLRVYVQ